MDSITDMTVSEVDLLLKQHLENICTYDLERLYSCFTYELGFHPEKSDAINDILEHIGTELTKRK